MEQEFKIGETVTITKVVTTRHQKEYETARGNTSYDNAEIVNEAPYWNPIMFDTIGKTGIIQGYSKLWCAYKIKMENKKHWMYAKESLSKFEAENRKELFNKIKKHYNDRRIRQNKRLQN